MRAAALIGAVALLLGPAGASASPTQQLTVRVLDEHGYPIPTAVVRFPVEGDRHPVNSETGAWRGDTLYLRDGSEVPFVKGGSHPVEVMAPGFEPESFVYEVAHARNTVVVRLSPMVKMPVCDARPQSRKCREQGEKHGVPMLVADGGPEVLDLTPETLSALADLREPNPELTSAFSAHLLALGPDYADQAADWATLAGKEARVLDGDAFVEVMDSVYEVRTKAATQQWQARHHAWLSSGFDWETRHEAETARKHTATLASEWAEWAEATGRDDETARLLCVTAEDVPRRCE